MIKSVFEERLDVVVTIVCWHTMALVVFLQDDEDVLSVYRNLKIFCETATSACSHELSGIPGFSIGAWIL